nr:6560_t:CDS:1 [Entrophospora candida]
MSRNIQEYILFQKQGYQCSTCHQNLQGKCENCNNQNKQLTGEFSNLKGINASNNQFTNLNFLNTLPNKEKLKGINLFGNQITEIDFAQLFVNFPNLEKINLQNNPISAKNLNNLTNQQFNKLVQGIKEKKIRIDSFKGTLLMDFLEYTQNLIKKGENTENAHKLQTILQNSSIENKQQSNNSKIP